MPRSSSALHQARLGVPGRRVGRVALGRQLERSDRVTLAQRGKPTLVVALGRLGVGVPALLVDGQEPSVRDHRARVAENSASRPSVATPPNRTVMVVPRASDICDASVRFQISS